MGLQLLLTGVLDAPCRRAYVETTDGVCKLMYGGKLAPVVSGQPVERGRHVDRCVRDKALPYMQPPLPLRRTQGSWPCQSASSQIQHIQHSQVSMNQATLGFL